MPIPYRGLPQLQDTPVDFPPPGTFTQLSAGSTHTCGVKSNSTVACWGDNVAGQATPPADRFTQPV